MMTGTSFRRTIMGAVVGFVVAGLLSAVSLAAGDPRERGNNRDEDTLGLTCHQSVRLTQLPALAHC